MDLWIYQRQYYSQPQPHELIESIVHYIIQTHLSDPIPKKSQNIAITPHIIINLQKHKMLTGIIKLAQIDDYISPSQNCIQPKIIKQPQQATKATVTLNDCLACSGCITSAESVLVEQMSVDKFMGIVSGEGHGYGGKGMGGVAVLVAPQVLLALGRYFGIGVRECLEAVRGFFGRWGNVVGVFEMTQAIEVCHELIFEQFLTRFNSQKPQLPILCSQCPGWVCYSQKTLPQKITSLMSRIKSPQQIMSHLIRSRINKKCQVVSIMPCYDKKLEAIRFQMLDESVGEGEGEDGGEGKGGEGKGKEKEVELTLAAVEFVELVGACGGIGKDKHKEKGNCCGKQEEKEQVLMKMEENNKKIDQNNTSCCNNTNCNKSKCTSNKCTDKILTTTLTPPPPLPPTISIPLPSPLPVPVPVPSLPQSPTFIKDQTSNGYIQFMLDRLALQYRIQQLKNNDYKQYIFEWKGQIRKMAKCYGFKNIQKLVQLIRKGKCQYIYVEVMACPGGCFGGGGQIRYQGVKNKDIIPGFVSQMHKYTISTGKRPPIDLSSLGIDRTQLQFEYKPIEKTLTQSVLNW